MARRGAAGLRWGCSVSLLGRWWGIVQLQGQDKSGLAHLTDLTLSQLRLARNLIANDPSIRVP